MLDKKMIRILGLSLSMATEFVCLVFVGVYLGRLLDNKLENETPYITALLTIIALFFGIKRSIHNYKKLDSFVDK